MQKPKSNQENDLKAEERLLGSRQGEGEREERRQGAGRRVDACEHHAL
jgi:hypothetical protein